MNPDFLVDFPGLGIQDLPVGRVAFSVFGLPVYWYGLLIAFSIILCMLLAMAAGKVVPADCRRHHGYLYRAHPFDDRLCPAILRGFHLERVCFGLETDLQHPAWRTGFLWRRSWRGARYFPDHPV